MSATAARTLSRDDAKEAGYSGYAEHLPNVPCPREADKSIYCATCQGYTASLSDSVPVKIDGDPYVVCPECHGNVAGGCRTCEGFGYLAVTRVDGWTPQLRRLEREYDKAKRAANAAHDGFEPGLRQVEREAWERFSNAVNATRSVT